MSDNQPAEPGAFRYSATSWSVRARYRQGEWTEPELTDVHDITLSEAAPALLYGQQVFEALTVRRVGDHAIAFRLADHAARLCQSAARILLPEPPLALVTDCVRACVKANAEFVPAEASEQSFFVRITLLGCGGRLSVRPAGETLLWVFGCPVGAIGRDGMRLRITELDRAAPRGLGAVKVGGNYAGGLLASAQARERGFDDALYLDPVERRFVTETNTANVIFSSAGMLVLPLDPTVLRSITVDSIVHLLHDAYGTEASRRRLPISELSEMDEAACVGNATGVRQVAQISDDEQSWTFGAGSVLGRAQKLLMAARTGKAGPDSWRTAISLGGSTRASSK